LEKPGSFPARIQHWPQDGNNPQCHRRESASDLIAGTDGIDGLELEFHETFHREGAKYAKAAFPVAHFPDCRLGDNRL